MRALIASLTLLSSLALAQNCPTRASWPTTEWPVALVDSTARAAQIKALEDYLFTLTGKDEERLGLRTDGLLIVKSGVIVYEKYARGFGPDNRHLSWSVAKSVSSALTGVAVKQGALSLDDSICTYLPEYAGTPQCAITVRDNVTFATGLAWQEGYENESYQTSSVISMLYGVGHRDQLRHILTHKLSSEPGKQWMYSTGDAALLSAVAKRALAKTHGRDAFWDLLFNPIGAGNIVFEEDELGTPLGGSMVYATPRDYARFGYLFLNDGCWDGQRLLPEGWVKSSTTPSAAFVASADKSETEPSGYMWWLNRAVPEHGNPAPWADSPGDAYSAIGHWGQYIAVVPSADVVIVRTGDDRNASVDLNKLISLSLAVAP